MAGIGDGKLLLWSRHGVEYHCHTTSNVSQPSKRMADEIDTNIGVESPMEQNLQKMPGPWYYEETENLSCSPINDPEDMGNGMNMKFLMDVRNITNHVRVPSSEHVAEIVGRQGCKIKALRAKTNTYIKTPVRGEAPVFMITGRHDDVLEAKHEIECAAEHFTQIRATRRNTQVPSAPTGQLKILVQVPTKVVGLVVGPKGATIKRIQQDTNTYIITPSKDRRPIFEVTGAPQNVEQARKEIEMHIYERTGNLPITTVSENMDPYQMNAPNKYGRTSVSPFRTSLAGNEFSDMGFDSLFRSFPSMRNSIDDYSHILRPASQYNSGSPLNASNNFIPPKNPGASSSKFGFGGYETWSNGELTENDVLTKSFDPLGSTSLWPSSFGLDSLEKRDDSPTNGLGSFHIGGSGFGILQSIWSDVPSGGSLTSASASPTSSSSENGEKTVIMERM